MAGTIWPSIDSKRKRMDMSIRRSIGALGTAAGLVALLVALSASSALAAGAPTVGAVSLASNGGVNWNEFETTVNPNGAATTAAFEFRRKGASTYEVGATVNVGSGTSSVPASAKIAGLKPYARYEYRVTASNSFGSNSSNFVGALLNRWRIVSGGKGQVSIFNTTGTGKIEWNEAGYQAKIECAESGSGTLGHEEGTGDSYTAHLSNCGYFLNGVQYCTTTPIDVEFDGSFKSTLSSINVKLCPGDEYRPLTFSAPFVGPAYDSSYTVVEPYTVTGATKMLGKAATMTISSDWSLSGEFYGLKFGVSTLE